MRLYRVILPVTDIESASKSYGGLLGMAGKRVSPGRHYFDCGGTILACYDAAADGDQQVFRSNPEHIYIAVDDLEAVHGRALAAGLKMEKPGIKMWPWGERSFYAEDWFGNPICFVDQKTVFTGQ